MYGFIHDVFSLALFCTAGDERLHSGNQQIKCATTATDDGEKCMSTFCCLHCPGLCGYPDVFLGGAESEHVTGLNLIYDCSVNNNYITRQ